MDLTRKRYQYIFVALLSAAIAVLCVIAVNKSYWSMQPFGGGYTKEEVRDMHGDSINELINLCSVPIGLIVFFSLFGVFASLKELEEPYNVSHALVFLWPIHICLSLPLFPIGMFLALLLGFLSAIFSKTEKTVYFSWAGLIHNTIASIVGWFHCMSVFCIFGD